MLLSELRYDEAYRVRGHEGIAFSFAGPETKPDEDTYWTGIEEPTGFALMVMVGDDRAWPTDPYDIELLPEGAYCGGCGQIGCMAYGTGEE